MNWRRGLIRVWIVISLIYGGVVLWVGGPDTVSNVKTLITLRGLDTKVPLRSLSPKAREIEQGDPVNTNLNRFTEALERMRLVTSKLKSLKKPRGRKPPAYADLNTYELMREVELRRQGARVQLQDFAMATVVLPALFWALLYVGFWIARGFKSGDMR